MPPRRTSGRACGVGRSSATGPRLGEVVESRRPARNGPRGHDATGQRWRRGEMQNRLSYALAAAALLGLAATGQAQQRIPVTKDKPQEPPRTDTVTVYRTDTVTVTRRDTVTVTQQVS